MTGVARAVAERAAAEWLRHDLPAPVADDLRAAVHGWCAHPPHPPLPPTAALHRQLDAFFASCGDEVLGTTVAEWHALPWVIGASGKAPDVAVVELIGPDGAGASDACRTGVLFQGAGHFYSWHHHAAEEFYLPISGDATWHAEGRKAETVPPREKIIHHAPWQQHATETNATPLLALWLWTGDLDMETYAMLDCE